MQNVASINSKSSIDEQRKKAETWRCWLPEMRKIAPKMSASLKNTINPAFILDRLTLREVDVPLSNTFHERAITQKDSTKKFYDLLMSDYYNTDRPGIDDEVKKAYNKATSHVIIKNSGDKYIDGTPVLSNYIIPEVRRSIKVTSLNQLKNSATAYYDNPEVLYDIQTSAQKTGNNIVVTLKSTNAKRTSNGFTRNIPVERTATEQHCYDVDIITKDDDHKDKKLNLKRETERRCDDRTYTYTENVQETGVANYTELRGTMSITINGRTVVKNKAVTGSYKSENSDHDITYAASEFADHVHNELLKQIKASAHL